MSILSSQTSQSKVSSASSTYIGEIANQTKSSQMKWRRANARNVSFSISVWWSIYIINSVDKPNFRNDMLGFLGERGKPEYLVKIILGKRDENRKTTINLHE